MAFQPFQPFSGGNKKRKTQTTTGSNMGREGAELSPSVPNPITTQGPLQNTASETAAKKAAASQVLAPQNTSQFGAQNAYQSGSPSGGISGPTFNNNNVAAGAGPSWVTSPVYDASSMGVGTSRGPKVFNPLGNDQLNQNNNISGRDDDPLSGDYDDPSYDDVGPLELDPAGDELRAEIDRILRQDASELARAEAGRIIAAQRAVMGRHGGTGGREAFDRDTVISATDAINERLNQEKLRAAGMGADLDKWQSGFDRAGNQWERGFDRAGDQFERQFDRQSDMWEADFAAAGRAEDRAVAAENERLMYDLMREAEALYDGDAAAMAEAMRAMVDPVTGEPRFTEEQILMATKVMREQALERAEREREDRERRSDREEAEAASLLAETENPSGWLADRLDEELEKGDEGRAWLIDEGDFLGSVMWKMEIPPTWDNASLMEGGYIEYPRDSGERWAMMKNGDGQTIFVSYDYLNSAQQSQANASGAL
ncbi:MAG: hypothetical protein CMM02_16160 [Rhodopirellula sp.]|nr:hypothetical protein [Rhodopirellula sp.]